MTGTASAAVAATDAFDVPSRCVISDLYEPR
ncbi:MAG: hypothetical protein JWO02_1075 [Solirubrobacterales bacterium]|nr:hypothetical protein [Solirubrobacterales bacterium]